MKGRKITSKHIQTVFSCACGFNEASTAEVKESDKFLKASGCVRKKDLTTGQPFYLHKTKAEACPNCQPENFNL